MNLRTTWIVALPLAVLVVTMVEPLTALFGREFDGTAPIISLFMIATFMTITPCGLCRSSDVLSTIGEKNIE